MAGQYNLNISQLKQFAPNSPILAFRPVDTGSPQQDWCRHLQKYPLYRQKLEEFSVLGDVVLRIADGIEPEPVERVKILSLEYAVKTLRDETDGKEFVRAVRAIASPDADQWELEQIAAYYYGEIRRRGTSEVLVEMGMLGMQLEAVTATLNEREFDFTETDSAPQKLTVADQRRVRLAQQNLPPLPAPTPNFDDELAAVMRRIAQPKKTRAINDDFAEFYLDDEGKSIEQLDADFISYDNIEQYDENGIIGFSMSGGQHSVVVYDLESEVDSSYLPTDARFLAREMNLIFVGHKIGGQAAQKARRFVLEQRILQHEISATKYGYPTVPTNIPSAGRFSEVPFSEEDFSEWLAAKLDFIYPHRAVRSLRRISADNAGRSCEYQAAREVNPDYDEMQYVSAVCRILWSQMRADFHLRSLRRKAYQNLHMELRRTKDTAEVARLKKLAYIEFKEQKQLSLKEFTALNTVAKSQEARLANQTSLVTRKTLADIHAASENRVRFLKYFLYNDDQIQNLTRQEKQRLWEAIRTRETVLQTAKNAGGRQTAKAIQQPLFRQTQSEKQLVRITPQVV